MASTDPTLYKALVYWAEHLDTTRLYHNFDLIEKVYRRTPWIQNVARERAVLLAEISKREAKFLAFLEGDMT